MALVSQPPCKTAENTSLWNSSIPSQNVLRSTVFNGHNLEITQYPLAVVYSFKGMLHSLENSQTTIPHPQVDASQNYTFCVGEASPERRDAQGDSPHNWFKFKENQTVRCKQTYRERQLGTESPEDLPPAGVRGVILSSTGWVVKHRPTSGYSPLNSSVYATNTHLNIRRFAVKWRGGGG